jgi:hypothetical protein
MKWIEPGDIRNWITRRQKHCQQTLPELVRRLILAHAGNNIEDFNFPIGDSTANQGWDGVLKTPVKSIFFPEGTSGWELSAQNERSIKSKANKDYEKRTADPRGLTPSESTFVFVTPQIFPDPLKWRQEKLDENNWNSILVIDGDKLEQWLYLTPATALWLARQTRDGVSGNIRDIEDAWIWWAQCTEPPMSTSLVLAGRHPEADRIRTWLGNNPDVLEVQGDHPDETYAFLYSSFAFLSELERSRALSRCIVVKDADDFKNCSDSFKTPLIIAAPSSCSELARVAARKGHHIFIAMDSMSFGRRDFLRLSRPKRIDVEKCLRECGLSESDSQRIARDSGRSIPVLRRHLLMLRGSIITPLWVSSQSAKVSVPILLAASWADDKKGDRKVIEFLSEMGYNVILKELSALLKMDDPPLIKVGNIWMLKSPLEAWFLLSDRIDNNILERFRQSICAVLTETHPKYDLPPENRWAAAMYDKMSNYSEKIRKGMIQSLVLMAVYGHQPRSPSSLQTFVSSVVREVLVSAKYWQAWASLKDVTPLLAEASPDAFLDVVQEVLAQNPSLFDGLLRDDGDAIFAECRHSGLLWALESLAWSPDYFAGAVRALAELAAIDPGGHWANRPSASLRDIFLPGFPQTNATPEARLGVFDALIEKDPRLVWQFSRAYFERGLLSQSYQFHWRDRGGERSALEPENDEQYRKYSRGLYHKLAQLASRRENVISSAGNFTRLNREIQDKVITALKVTDSTMFSNVEIKQLVGNIREQLNWINTYGKNAILDHIGDLNEILNKYTPQDAIERVGWLLENPWPRLPEGEAREFAQREESIIRAQKAAAREVLDQISLKSALRFGRSVEYPGVFGRALSHAVRDDNEDVLVLDELLRNVPDNTLIIIGYSAGRIQIAGPLWPDRQIKRTKDKGNYSPESCALFCLGLPEGPETWLKVSALGSDVEQAYWHRATGQSPSGSSHDAETAVKKLLEVHRPERAIKIAGQPTISISSSLIRQLILEFLKSSPKDKEIHLTGMSAYHLGYLFNQLYDRNELSTVEIAQLEWPFASLFDDFKHSTSEPQAIHRLLQQDTALFAHLVSFVYKRDDGTPDPEHEGMEKTRLDNMTHASKPILDSWRLMPGLKDDGTIVQEELMEWVESARQVCDRNKYVTGGDLQIAKMLSHAPSDADGAWPHRAVRNVIEHVASQIIDEHIEIELYNSRGATTRILGTGGAPERELSANYKIMSDELKIKWPRTARILRSLANTYENEANQHDISADLHDLE